MSRLADGQPAQTPPASSDEPRDIGLSSTIAVDCTLAIPLQPRIREAQTVEFADTLPPSDARDSASSAAASRAADGNLREPIAGNHYRHAYQTDGTQPKELGRGGIGRVVLVFDRTLGRDVAMKELLPELLTEEGAAHSSDGSPLAQRFLREARITGQLEHPNIVPVYELGRQPSGCLYYTMRVVRGRTLASAIQAAATPSQRLGLINHFAGLCQAIAYAHSRGVVHRDIKPENVMIGEFGETFVLDWGLANIVEEQSPMSLRAASSLSLPPVHSRPKAALSPGTAATFHTQCGSIVGTPQYMSPEQLLQRTDGCSPTSDVWSLGVVLYYILTGTLPFAASNFGELLLQMQQVQSVDIDPSATDVPRDLAAIAKRALTRDPNARYPTARDMARDIAAYQAGDKVTAYEYSSLELLRRFARRNRASLLVSAAALVALLVLGVSSYWRIMSARDAALAAEYRAKASLSDVLVERARAEASDGNVASATLLAAGALELMERSDARGMLLALANADRLEQLSPPRATQPQTATSTAPEQPVKTTRPVISASSNTGRYFATADDSGTVELQSPTSSSHIAMYRAAQPITALAFHPSEPLLALGGFRGDLLLWRWASEPAPIPLGSTHCTARALAFAPKDQVLAAGGSDGTLTIWDFEQRQLLLAPMRAASNIVSLSFMPNGRALAVAARAGIVDILDSRNYERTLRSSVGSTIRQFAFTSDTELVGVLEDNSPLHFRVRRALPQTRYTSRGNVLSLSWAASGADVVVAGLGEHGICRLDLVSGACGDRLPIRAGLVRRVVNSPDQRLFVVGGTGGKIEVWDAIQRLPRGYIDIPIAEVRDVAFLPGGNRLAVVGNAPALLLLDLDSMQVVENQALPGPAQTMLLLAQQQQLVVGLRNGHLLRRSLARDTFESDAQLVSGWPIGLALSTKHGWLAVAEDNGKITFLDPVSQRPIDSVSLGSGRLMAFAFSDQLDLVAVAGEDRVVYLVSTNGKPKLVARLVEHQGTLRTLLFDDRNDRLYSAGDDGMIRLWPLNTLRQSATELRRTAEKVSGMHLDSGRIVRDAPK